MDELSNDGEWYTPVDRASQSSANSQKIRVCFPTFNKFSIVSTPPTTQSSNSLMVEKETEVNFFNCSGELIGRKNLRGQNTLVVKNALDLKPTDPRGLVFSGNLDLLHSTIVYNYKHTSFSWREVNNKKDHEYIPYDAYKEYKCSFWSRSAISAGHANRQESVYPRQCFNWEGFTKEHEEKYNESGVFEAKAPTGAASGDGNSQLWVKKPGVYRLSVAVVKDGRWLDNGHGGANVLKVTFPGMNKTYILGVLTTRGQTNYNYRSSGILGVTVAAEEEGFFWLQCTGASYRVFSFDWTIIRLPSMQYTIK